MSRISIVLTVLCLAVLALSQNHYSDFASFANPDGFSSVVWAHDQSYVLLFGQNSRKGLAFRSYDWQPVTDETLVEFEFAPKNIEFFTDGQHQTNLIYSNSEGKVRRRIYNSAGYTELMLYSVPTDSNTSDIKRATASSDGSLYAMFCQEDSLVYIGDLRKQVSLKKVLDYSQKGQVRSIRWRPGTTELVISGGSGEDRYFFKYDTTTELIEDWVFLADGPVTDIAFSPDGNTVYFIQAPESEQNDVDQVIWQHNLISKERKQFVEDLLPQALSSIEVKGNFLSARNDQQQYIWKLADGSPLGSYKHSMSTSGLSPDGSDMISVQNTTSTAFKVLKLCGDLKHIYDTHSDSCLACQIPCSTCFSKVDQCSSCLDRYFFKGDFTCGQCSIGCFSCNSENACDKCDEDSHWTKDQHDSCVCSDGYLQTQQKQCLSCQSFMEGCLLCSAQNYCLSCQQTFGITNKNVCEHCSTLIEGCNKCSSADSCTECADGYSLNEGSKKCEEQSSNTVLIIVIIVIVVVVLVVVGVFVWRWAQKKKGKKIESALESQALEDYEKVEDN